MKSSNSPGSADESAQDLSAPRPRRRRRDLVSALGGQPAEILASFTEEQLAELEDAVRDARYVLTLTREDASFRRSPR